jgi:glycosyltransferase involved in cell wall biosynthesis
MTQAAVAFDLTRLITRLAHASPSGIDRVDLAYARHFLGQDGARFGVVSTVFGPRVLDRDAARAVVDAVASGWVEDLDAGSDPVYHRLVASIGAGRASPSVAPAPSRSGIARRRIQLDTNLLLLRAGGHEALPRGTVYLHTSHLRLDRPERFDWLYDRPDIRPVFFVHDLIPIAYPEYGRPGEAERHATRMETVARHAAHVVVNSADVGAHFSGYLALRGLGAKPVTVGWLGVEPVFLEREGQHFAPVRPTFVVCGTIEPRKNHLLLLNLWRELAAEFGDATPRLVLVGRRGWEAENVVDMLDRCRAVRAHVTEVAGLSTQGLAALMRSATGLLMPSFAEGYGLPVVEAAASGLPVIASDIAVHREIGGDFAEFLDPLDGVGWRRTILALAEVGSPLRADLRARLDGYAAPTWPAHFDAVERALAAAGG